MAPDVGRLRNSADKFAIPPTNSQFRRQIRNPRPPDPRLSVGQKEGWECNFHVSAARQSFRSLFSQSGVLGSLEEDGGLSPLVRWDDTMTQGR